MNKGTRLLDVSRKQLKDIKTVRNYSCRWDLELLANMKVIYKTSIDELIGGLPGDYDSDYFIRPRKRRSLKDHLVKLFTRFILVLS